MFQSTLATAQTQPRCGKFGHNRCWVQMLKKAWLLGGWGPKQKHRCHPCFTTKTMAKACLNFLAAQIHNCSAAFKKKLKMQLLARHGHTFVPLVAAALRWWRRLRWQSAVPRRCGAAFAAAERGAGGGAGQVGLKGGRAAKRRVCWPPGTLTEPSGGQCPCPPVPLRVAAAAPAEPSSWV